MGKKKDCDLSGICCVLPIILMVLWMYRDTVRVLLAIFLLLLVFVGIPYSIYKKGKKEKFEQEQIAKGLVKFVDSTGNEKWGTREQVKRWTEIDIGLFNNFATLTPYQFEEFIAKLFRKMGYDAKRTKSTGDFGADVIIKDEGKIFLIEVKKYAESNKVGPKELQRAIGALDFYKANEVLFITTSDFTKSAIAVEKKADGKIILWNKKELHKMVRKYFIDEAE